jgi:hypothetical protein
MLLHIGQYYYAHYNFIRSPSICYVNFHTFTFFTPFFRMAFTGHLQCRSSLLPFTSLFTFQQFRQKTTQSLTLRKSDVHQWKRQSSFALRSFFLILKVLQLCDRTRVHARTHRHTVLFYMRYQLKGRGHLTISDICNYWVELRSLWPQRNRPTYMKLKILDIETCKHTAK